MAKGWSERQPVPIRVLIFPKPSDREGFTPSDLFAEYPDETVTGAWARDGPLFLRKVEMIAHVEIKEQPSASMLATSVAVSAGNVLERGELAQTRVQ